MKNKLMRLGRLLYTFIFILALFTLLRIIVKYYYALRQADGDYTYAMMILDKAHIFQLYSYVAGVLHGWVVWIMFSIITEK